MSRELIYTANTAGAAVPIGNTVPLGSIIRRYGNCISANGAVINIRERGYYDVDISATFTAAAAGNVTLTLLQDGVPVPGATATSTIDTATTQVENIAIAATVRVMCCGNSNISVIVGGTTAPTISNMAVQVTKI